MGSKLGPKIINDELVLSLDAADANSYAGEPVANLVTSSAVDFSVRSTYSGNTFSQVADSESPSGYACEMSYTGTVNSSSRSRFGAATNIPTSGTGFVSIWAKKSAGSSTTMRPKVYTGAGDWSNLDPLDGGSIYFTDEYRPFGKAVSFGTASGGPNPGFSMTNGGNTTVNDKTRWIKPQVTTLSYNVPFSNLTRPNQIDFISHGDVGSGTTFTDSSVNNLTLTSSNGASHAGTGPFGGSAMSFVRASSQQITSASTSLCDFGTGDFTIDFWFNMNSGTATNTRMHALNIGSGNSTNISFDFNDSGYGIWLYWMGGGSPNIRQSGNYRNDGLWHHCAFVRDNGTCRLWIDGAYIGGVSYATQIGATQSLYIGSASGGQHWDGYIDEVRIIKGTALWRGTNNFSVPTSRGKNASLLDLSSNNNNGSLINGTGTSTTHYRDGQVIMPLTSAYLEFDGTDSYISTSFGNGHNPATNPISYTLWVKAHTNSGSRMIFVQGNWNGNFRAYFGYTGAKWGMGIQSSGWGSTQGGDTVTTNTWHHMCMVFEGSTCKWYRNGSLMFSKSYTSYAFNQNLIIGEDNYDSTDRFWDGEIAQVLVHNKALTAAEVLNNYNTTKSRFS
jgi:hypothetical protein